MQTVFGLKYHADYSIGGKKKDKCIKLFKINHDASRMDFKTHHITPALFFITNSRSAVCRTHDSIFRLRDTNRFIELFGCQVVRNKIIYETIRSTIHGGFQDRFNALNAQVVEPRDLKTEDSFKQDADFVINLHAAV